MLEIETRRLDPASLDYLTRIDQSWGRDGTGVFIRRSGRRSDPLLLPRLAVYAGLLAVGLVVVGVALRYFMGGNLLSRRSFQAPVLALGGGLLVGGGLALRRPTSHASLGDFYWADSLHFWEVSPEQVRYLPLERVRQARGQVRGYTTEHVFGMPVADARVYNTFTAITLDVLAGSPVYFTVYDLKAAERLIHFINKAAWLRRSELVSGMPEVEPDRRERTAIQLSRSGAEGLPTEAGDVSRSQPGLPTPHQVEPVARTARPATWERLAPWLVAILLGGLGLLGL